MIAAWVAFAVGLLAVSHVAGSQTSDNLSLPGTGSTNAQNLLKKSLPNQAFGTNPIVLQAKSGTLDDSRNKQAVDGTVSSLKKQSGVIDAISPLSQEGAAALSKDKKIGYISVTLKEGPSDLTEDDANAVIDAAQPARDAGLKVATGGYLGQAVSKTATESSEAIGLAAAVVILLFAFGTATAMALPLVTAVIGLVSALSVIRLLGHVVEVPSVAPTLATMIGLGVGIDYALFIITRHKLQLRDGMEMRESIARATATSGHGAGALGLDGAVAIVSYVPLLMFAILFGLSMDYEVFLLSQIQEHHGESKDTHQAVIDGLATTGRVITSAALIMVFVFASFVLSGNAIVKQFGIGLAVAIAIDATIVRCLVVPAIMTLLGESSWWLPRWLAGVLPRISVEGSEYFAKREAASTARR